MTTVRAQRPTIAILWSVAVAAWASALNAAEVPLTDHSSGREYYVQYCSACHGDQLRGGFGPALSGITFKERWSHRAAELLQYVSQKMPPSGPGGLEPAVYRDITVYLRMKAGFGSSSPQEFPDQPATSTAPVHAEGPTAVPYGPLAADDHGGIANQDAAYQTEVTRLQQLVQRMKPVNDLDLLNPREEDWLLWRRTYAGLGYSPLKDINKTNIKNLTLAWSLALPTSTNEVVPLAYQGLLFINSNGTIEALEASTGDLLWKYVRPSKRQAPVSQARGMALHGSTLFFATEDGHVVAVDARSGETIWDHLIFAPAGKPQLTSGPLVVHGKVIQGVSGCSGTDIIGGCYLVALDEHTGEEVWRFNTIPRPGEFNGDSWNGAPIDQRLGGSIWSTPSYDPDLNLIFVGTGNTYNIGALLTPRLDPSRQNAGLYTDTTLAFNPDSGKLVWYYQHFARDVWNLDWAFERSLIDLPTPNGKRRVVVTVGKLNILDILDAKTGHYLGSFDYGQQNLVSSIDPKTGAKNVRPEMWPVKGQPQIVCPYAGGGRDWYASAIDPRTNMIYLPIVEACMRFHGEPFGDRAGLRLELIPPPDTDGKFGQISGVSLDTRQILWKNRRRAPQASSALATAGDLLFEGSRDRTFRALDSATGAVLWSTVLASVVDAFPITFKADGTQYIAVTSGGGGMVDGTLRPLTPEQVDPPQSTTLWVFSLPR